jgi:hypothetical protein
MRHRDAQRTVAVRTAPSIGADANSRMTMTPLRTLFDLQNERFLAGTTRSRQWRLDQLDRLERMLSENR